MKGGGWVPGQKFEFGFKSELSGSLWLDFCLNEIDFVSKFERINLECRGINVGVVVRWQN